MDEKKFISLEGLRHYNSKVTEKIAEVRAAIPTKTSQITNDSGFLLSSDLVTLGYATQTYVDGKVAAHENAVTEALGTINGTLGDHTTAINNLTSNKVDKDGNKVLSTNDFTNELETKLEGIEEGAQKNAVGTVVDANYKHITVTATSVSDGTNTFTKYDDTAVKALITAAENKIPTATSQLTNDSGFITNAAVEAAEGRLNDKITAAEGKIPTKTSQLTNDSDFADKTYVNTAIGNLSTIKFTVVTELPTENISTSTVYLKSIPSSVEPNLYEEWIYVEGKWEIIGTTKTDLTNYVTTEQLATVNATATAANELATELSTSTVKYTDAATNAEIDGLFA